MEIMDALAIEAAESSMSAGYPRAPALLIVELDGEREAVESDFARLEHVIRDSGASEVRVTQDPVERERIWRGRKGAFSSVGWLSADYLVQDGCVPRTRLGETLGAIERLASRHSLRVANVFHAGDGNLHPLLSFDRTQPGVLERVLAASDEIVRLCVEAGGALSGEHGIGLEKRDFMPLVFSPEDLAAQDCIRSAFDPDRLMNPQKVLPDGARCGDFAMARGQDAAEAAARMPEGSWI
jgi:glycolate oxidase